MRLSRRHLLRGFSAGGLAFAAGQADAREKIVKPGLRPVTVRAQAFRDFDLHDRERVEFGALRFKGGLVLTADDPDFGGFSSLRMLDRDGRFITLSDQGTFLLGRLAGHGEAPSGVEQAQMAPALHSSGVPLVRSRSYDTESMAFRDGELFVGVERTNEILRFDWRRDGVLARGQPIAAPARLKALPHNLGIEALGVMPAGSSSPGSLIAISERSGGIDAPTIGFLLGGPRPGEFEVIRHDRFAITDLDFLPSGDLILLERFFTWATGVRMRMRRIPLRSIKPGASLDGEILLTADMGYEIDNMEGLSISADVAGRTLFTLISDDNFSILQRTLMLQFQWLGD